MKKSVFIGKLASYDILNCSVNGNPAYSGVFVADNGEVLCGRTTSDASCAYGFLNYRDRTRKVTYHVTRGGKVHFDYITIMDK